MVFLSAMLPRIGIAQRDVLGREKDMLLPSSVGSTWSAAGVTYYRSEHAVKRSLEIAQNRLLSQPLRGCAVSAGRSSTSSVRWWSGLRFRRTTFLALKTKL